MVKIKIDYEGELHCRLMHEPSGTTAVTDAPRDNMGRGESFSPTDLVAAALGACMMTIMGIYAKRQGIRLEGARVDVTKEMVSEPERRIGRLTVRFSMPPGIEAKHRPALERSALTCPVHKSLHPGVEIPVDFHYPD
jgi:putative redox protein